MHDKNLNVSVLLITEHSEQHVHCNWFWYKDQMETISVLSGWFYLVNYLLFPNKICISHLLEHEKHLTLYPSCHGLYTILYHTLNFPSLCKLNISLKLSSYRSTIPVIPDTKQAKSWTAQCLLSCANKNCCCCCCCCWYHLLVTTQHPEQSRAEHSQTPCSLYSLGQRTKMSSTL